MLSEEKLKTLPEPSQAYWRKAQEYVTKMGTGWFAIRPGTDEFDSWVEYFRKQRWKPWGLKQLEHNRIEIFLVPAQWPEWFETAPIRTASLRSSGAQHDHRSQIAP